MSGDMFDVWTDRDNAHLRVVVREGDGIPPYYASRDMRLLGSTRVADDIAADVIERGCHVMTTNLPFSCNAILGDPLSFNRYADADPDEIVSVGGQAMSLRTAVHRWIKARDATRGTSQIVTGITPREVGKEPGSFLPEDMDRLAEMERFR